MHAPEKFSWCLMCSFYFIHFLCNFFFIHEFLFVTSKKSVALIIIQHLLASLNGGTKPRVKCHFRNHFLKFQMGVAVTVCNHIIAYTLGSRTYRYWYTQHK